MTTKTKTKVNVSKKPFAFKQLLGRVLKHDHFARLLKAAANTGWLTDETFLTRLTDAELDVVKAEYRGSSHAKRAIAAEVTKDIPEVVGSMVESAKPNKTTVRLTAGGHAVTVDGRLYDTMARRHPKATIYLSPENDKVIFAEKVILAILPAL